MIARRPPIAAVWAAVLLAWSAAPGTAAFRAASSQAGSADCPVRYSSISQPLLFGGVATAGCERSSGGACGKVGECKWCKNWRDICRFKAYDKDAKDCTPEQVAGTLKLASTADGGAPLQLSPCDLYPYLRGRTLWLIGDSHTRALFRSMQCFLLDLWEDQRVCQASPDDDLVKQLDKLPLKPGTSKCIHLAGGGRVCLVHAVQGWSLMDNPKVADGGVLQLLHDKLASPDDIFVVNFGTWHGPHGVEPKPRNNIEMYKVVLEKFGKYYNETRAQWPHVLFRESPTSHPEDPKTGACLAYPDPSVTGSLDTAAREVLPRYGMPVVGGAREFTMPSPWGHPGKRASYGVDCLHYCSPGITELLLWELSKAFQSGATGIAPLPASAPIPQRECKEMRYY